MNRKPILTINTGSSSLKLGIFVQKNDDEAPLLEALIDGFGTPNVQVAVRDEARNTVHSAQLGNLTKEDALREVNAWLSANMKEELVAVGHRVVHGGPGLTSHQKITPQLLGKLRGAVHFAPLHIPVALALIEAAQRIYPKVDDYACFDTAFHRTLPEAAARFALPKNLFKEGVRRYGFHGLSYESIVHAMRNDLPERVVIAHLGNGASLAALNKGVSIDTTMALTPTAGIPMGTRSGDLDPGVILYLLRNKHLQADGLEDLLNHKSGLLGLSGTTSDMRDLESAAARNDADARLAIDIFARSIKKTIGSYAALLGGLDLLVFTGGIGEHSVSVRAAVCAGLDFLGIQLDAKRNAANTGVISGNSSHTTVRVMTSQEDLQIARLCRAMIS